MKLYYQKFFLPNKKIIGKIFYLHGYATNNTYWSTEICKKLAENGYCVYTLDYEGHGKSDGLWVYIEDFSFIEKDVSDFIVQIINKEYRNLKTFLIGDSMGGAVAINVLKKQKHLSSGCVLIAPMIKISDNAKPSEYIRDILIYLCDYIPTFPILPNNNLPESGFHPLVSRRVIYSNPLIYNQKPRLKTALELYKVSCEIEENLDKIDFPYIVIHGLQDKLTDCSHSKFLYNSSKSKDKTIKIYDEGYHCLLDGPFKDLVYDDILVWLNNRIF
jgi:acylglycerol lipase